MSLGQYIEDQRQHRWETGLYDCTTYPGDWARSWGCGDPMAEWRGRYSSDAEAATLIEDAGGLGALFGRGLCSVGARAISSVSEGAVAVIRAFGCDGDEQHIGAIWTGRRWSFRTPAGLAFASAEVIGMWSRG